MTTPEIALLFFFGVFMAIVLRLVFSKSARWQQHARIPLDETGDGGSNDVR